MWTRPVLIMVSEASGVWKQDHTEARLAAPFSLCRLHGQMTKSALDNFLT